MTPMMLIDKLISNIQKTILGHTMCPDRSRKALCRNVFSKSLKKKEEEEKKIFFQSTYNNGD